MAISARSLAICAFWSVVICSRCVAQSIPLPRPLLPNTGVAAAQTELDTANSNAAAAALAYGSLSKMDVELQTPRCQMLRQ